MLTDSAVLNPSPAAVDAPLFSVLGRKAYEAILARNSVDEITRNSPTSLLVFHPKRGAVTDETPGRSEAQALAAT